VADITYIRTRSGWLYLAAVLDLYSRGLVGWAMAHSMPSELVCSALEMAIAQRQPAPGPIVHSDRGSQYASQAHRDVLQRHGLVASMSRKGNCWDNAVMERFFLNLKMERVWQHNYANHAEATRTSPTTSWASTTAVGFTPPWVTCRPMLMTKMIAIRSIEVSKILDQDTSCLLASK
jgi:transposase InsO family protein